LVQQGTKIIEGDGRGAASRFANFAGGPSPSVRCSLPRPSWSRGSSRILRILALTPAVSRRLTVTVYVFSPRGTARALNTPVNFILHKRLQSEFLLAAWHGTRAEHTGEFVKHKQLQSSNNNFTLYEPWWF
jgi:hypothetical protein